MPILRINEIRNMTPEERSRKLDELRTELRKLKTTVNAGGSIENPGGIRSLKKAIARILTIIREEEIKV